MTENQYLDYFYQKFYSRSKKKQNLKDASNFAATTEKTLILNEIDYNIYIIYMSPDLI